MKKRIVAIMLLVLSFLCIGCKKEFEYGYDKFYLKEIGTGGRILPHYIFIKKIDVDMIFEPYSKIEPNGYQLYGDSKSRGQWDYMGIQNAAPTYEMTAPEIVASFVCFSETGMGNAKLNIYFNYTVASTGERKEEVWAVDFGQTPYEDKR